jgi:hypothetical protein
VDQVFEEEQPFLLSAPVLFEGYKHLDVKVSTTSLVRFDRNNYSVHCSCAGQIVQLKVFADLLILSYEGREVGYHERRFTRGETYYDWRHYLPLLEHKPGALRNGAPFREMCLPSELTTVRQHLESQKEGARDFAYILSYIASYSLEAVVRACLQAIKDQTISKDVILNILSRQDQIAESVEEIDPVYPPLHYIPQSNLKAYDLLLSGACQ